MMGRIFSNIRSIFRLPYLPIWLGPVVLFAPSLFTGRVLFWGLPALQFIPWRAFAWESMQNGLLPLWNPFNGLGAPLIANYQLAFFYPPGWLVYLFAALGGIPLMAWSHTLLVVLHLVWAGTGMALFVRSLGLGVLAQTVSGLAFSLGGYLVARNSFFSMIWAAAWLPWILFAITDTLLKERIRFSFRLLIFINFQLLAGHAQLTWYSLLLAGLWTVFYSWSRYGIKKGLHAALVFLGTLLAAAALASVQLLPTAEYLLQSQRSNAVDYELGLTYSYWPWRLLTMISPDFFGNPGSGTYFGYAAYWEDAAYIGLIPLILAVSTVKRTLSRKIQDDSGQKSIFRFWWVIILVGFILALGKNLPVFLFLYKNVPTFGLFNAPARWMFWVVVGLCVLAGYGAEAWRAPVGKAIRRFRLALVVTLAVTVGAGLAWLVLRDVRLTFIQSTAVTGIWGIVFCVLALRMPKEGMDKNRWNFVVAGLIATDLVAAQFSLIPTTEAGFFNQNGPVLSVAQGQRVYLSYTDEYTLKFQRFFRIANFNPLESWSNLWQVMLPDFNILARTAYVNNFDPLLPGRYAALINYLDKLPPEKRIGFLNILDVGLVESIDPAIPEGVQFQPVQTGGRFQWAPCAIYAADENESFQKLVQNVDLLAQGRVIVEGKGSDTPCIAPGKAVIQVLQDSSLQYIVSVNADQAGWLVMADTWYPGWEAQVDGKAAPVLNADYLLRGVYLARGAHQVEFAYHPFWYRIGSILSVAGWAFLLFFAIIFIFRPYLRRNLE